MIEVEVKMEMEMGVVLEEEKMLEEVEVGVRMKVVKELLGEVEEVLQVLIHCAITQY